VGTELITSRDAPAISMVYKLVEQDGKGRIKRSPGKKTYPMAKQVYRVIDGHGKFVFDQVTRADEVATGQAMLVPVVRQGKLATSLPGLAEIQNYCRSQRQAMPDYLRGLVGSASYPLRYSPALEAEADRLGVHGGEGKEG